MARPALYDWDKWFARRQIVLWWGRDYHCSQSSMVQQIRNNAGERDVKVRIVDSGDYITIYPLQKEVVGNGR